MLLIMYDINVTWIGIFVNMNPNTASIFAIFIAALKNTNTSIIRRYKDMHVTTTNHHTIISITSGVGRGGLEELEPPQYF